MKITRKKVKSRKSKIYALFFVKRLKKKEIAEKLNLHRNTIWKYIKKCEKNLT